MSRRYILAVLAGALLAAGCEREAQAPQTAAPVAALAPASATPTRPPLAVYLADDTGLGELKSLNVPIDAETRLAVLVRDPQGRPAADQPLSVSSRTGNALSDAAPVSGPDGYARFMVAAIVPGRDVITVRSPFGALGLTLDVGQDVQAAAPEHAPVSDTGNGELPSPADALSWDVLAKVKWTEKDGLPSPRFNKEQLALDGQEVVLPGFMLPLDQTPKQKHFLLSRTPPSCFYCMPGGPEEVVEVLAAEGLAFSMDPFVLKGRLELLKSNEMGLFYRLKDARVAPRD